MRRRTALLLVSIVLAQAGCSSLASDSSTDAMPPADAASGPVEIVADPQRIAAIDVAFDGEAYAVAWSAYRSALGDDAIVLSRVSTTGEVLLPAQVITETGVHVTEVEVFPTPGGYALWYRERVFDGAAITVLAVDREGAVVTPPRDIRTTGEGFEDRFAAEWNGQELAALSVARNANSTDPRHVEFWTVSSDLVTLSSPALVEPGSADQNAPHLTWVPVEQSFLALWIESSRVRTTTIAPDGTAAPSVEVVAGGPSQTLVAASADPSGGVVAVLRHGDLQLTLAHTDDSVAWTALPDLLPANRQASVQFAVASSGGVALVTWVSDADTALPVGMVGLFDRRAGSPTFDAWPVTDPAFAHHRTAAAAGPPGAFAAVFVAQRDGSDRVYFAPVTAP